MKLHELFALLMKAGGIRKSEIARGTRVTWSAVHQWVIGETVPDTQNMLELQDILGIRNIRYSQDREVIAYELTTPGHRRAEGEGEILANVTPVETELEPLASMGASSSRCFPVGGRKRKAAEREPASRLPTVPEAAAVPRRRTDLQCQRHAGAADRARIRHRRSGEAFDGI